MNDSFGGSDRITDGDYGGFCQDFEINNSLGVVELGALGTEVDSKLISDSAGVPGGIISWGIFQDCC